MAPSLYLELLAFAILIWVSLLLQKATPDGASLLAAAERELAAKVTVATCLIA